jgi:hypothetical protein
MAITYPRELLDAAVIDFEESSFELVNGVSLARSQSDRVLNAIQIADPYWRAHIVTQPLELNERKRWRAWYESLRHGMKTFLAYDLAHEYPIAYPTGIPAGVGSPAWDGTGDVLAIAAHEAQVGGLPVGFILSEGDYFGLVQSGRYHVFTVPETVVAQSGGIITVPVNPAIPLTAFTTSATAVFWRPRFQMIVENGSFVCPGVEGLAAVSFDGVQVI